jgi:hypothetical protein
MQIRAPVIMTDMFNKRDIAHKIFRPNTTLPGQRRFTGGKNLDGSFWIEIEGQGRVTMPPQAAFDMAVGILRDLGIEIQFDGRPQ